MSNSEITHGLYGSHNQTDWVRLADATMNECGILIGTIPKDCNYRYTAILPDKGQAMTTERGDEMHKWQADEQLELLGKAIMNLPPTLRSANPHEGVLELRRRHEAAEARIAELEKAGRTLSTLLHDLEKGGVELTEYADEIWARATEVIDRTALSTGAVEEK